MDRESKIRVWLFHGEWATLMAAVLGCFLFVHKENIHINERLDAHIAQINKRCDQLNARTDELHREFYELLREMRSDRS